MKLYKLPAVHPGVNAAERDDRKRLEIFASLPQNFQTFRRAFMQKLHADTHFGKDCFFIALQKIHTHLYRGFAAIGSRQHAFHHTGKYFIGNRIDGDRRAHARLHFADLRLRNIHFRLQ